MAGQIDSRLFCQLAVKICGEEISRTELRLPDANEIGLHPCRHARDPPLKQVSRNIIYSRWSQRDSNVVINTCSSDSGVLSRIARTIIVKS